MVEQVETAIIRLWGENIGAVSWLKERGYAIFEYEPDFLPKGLELSPIYMGLDTARRGDGIIWALTRPDEVMEYSHFPP